MTDEKDVERIKKEIGSHGMCKKMHKLRRVRASS